MGQTETKSILAKHGYTVNKDGVNGVKIVTSKQGEQFVVKEIRVSAISKNTAQDLKSEIEALKNITHPHILSYRNSFYDTNESGEDCHYVVREHCLGGTLAERISAQKQSGLEFDEDQIMTWIVQLCMSLKHAHSKRLLHQGLKPQNVFLTEFGSVRLGEFGNLSENLTMGSSLEEGAMHYLSPETLNAGLYDNKSDIWSLGCILYELCTLNKAFSAQNTMQLIPTILGGPYPSLPDRFPPELNQLLDDIFQTDPTTRPSARDILARPFIIRFLTKKCNKSVEEIQSNLDKLNALADDLERVHEGTTIGSLTGGVIGAAGGITSIVGLILAPFTLGASLIVTGVGIGVAVAGGATAGVSNITDACSQSSNRRIVRSIVREVEEKTCSVVTSLQDIGESLETLRENVELSDFDSGWLSTENLQKVGAKAGRGLGGIPELVRLVQVARLGNAAAQTAKVIRIAEVATGVLSVFFVAVDLYFIAMDAREISRIKEARSGVPVEETNSLQMMQLCPDSESESHPEADVIRSETMRFVASCRNTSTKLQEVVNELRDIITLIS